MTAAELLDSLARQKVKVWAEGEQLRYRAPKGVLTPSLRAELAEHKAEIMALLRQREKQDAGPRLPQIVPDPAKRHQPFPLNDMQHAYWVGRLSSFEMGNVAGHSYMELECVDLDLERLNQAWQRVIDRHDMLRAIVRPDGQQQILEQVPPYRIQVVDLNAAELLEQVRQHMSHQILPAEQWPLFDIRAFRLDDRRTRLHISIDGILADAWSLNILIREWVQFYREPGAGLAPLELSFRDYVLAEIALRDSELYKRCLDYWRKRLVDLPPAPELPLAKTPAALACPQFVGQSQEIDPQRWLRLKARAAQAGLTPSGLLLAVYAEVLAAWSKHSRFTISVPCFNRFPFHPQVESLVGEFASFTLVEVNVSGQDSFEARARRIQDQLMQNLEHGYVSGVQILRELTRIQARPSGVMMPVVFTTTFYQASQYNYGSLLAVTQELGEMIYGVNQTPQVWLDFQVSERDGALFLHWEAVEELFPPGLMAEMFGAYGRLIQRLADEEDLWQQATWPLIPPAQAKQREEINATQAPIPDTLLHMLFAEQVPRRPHQVAVVAADRKLTYEELDRRSNQVGRRLRELGIRPNQLVAVVMEKGWEQIVAVLGIHKAGAAYLPIAAEMPGQRLQYLLEDGQAEVVLTQSWLDERLAWPANVQRLYIDRGWAGADDRPMEPAQTAQDLAYVIYTSGSTGQPKGVMIAQRGLVNAIVHTNRRFEVTHHDRVLALTALHHDMSAYDIFGILAAGGTIVIPSASAAQDPAHWAELIHRERVTLWNSVPTFMEMFVEYLEHAGRPDLRPVTLRLAFLGGDWIPLTLPDRIRALAGNVQVVSVGGPTETTLWNIWYPIEKVDPAWKSIPYGRPIANTRYYVLSETLEHRPVWVPGQIYCAGIGLAKGYWRNQEKTQASFITHPRTGERLYRTGDLGRYLPDGNIEFLGREDFQIKIHGWRIELGEIETTLAQHPAIKAAVVTAVGKPQERRRLVGYIVPTPGHAPASDELRRYLAGKLPEYMIPTTFISLEALPLTSNGKVDRSALPAPDLTHHELAGDGVAQDPVEQELASLFASVLGVEQVGIHDNFFELGGDSVQAVQLISRIRDAFYVELSLRDLFAEPSVASLAVQIARSQAQQQDSAVVTRMLEELEQLSEDEVKALLAHPSPQSTSL